MAQEDVEREDVERVVRAGYAAANGGDFDALLPLLDPGIEFNSLIAEVEGRTYRGYAGAREWWEGVASSLNGLTFDPQEITVFGSSALVRLRVSGTVEGVEVPQTMWHSLRVRDGLVTWWHLARSREEAARSLGLAG